jgi:hypothetical protein
MEKAAHWVLDGPIEYDAGDLGGDIQLGPAVSARFRSDDCPEARFEVIAYVTAKTYSELGESEPDCPHEMTVLERSADGGVRRAKMPEEHSACSWKPGTVDVQAQYVYRMNGRVDEYGNYESDGTDEITYEWVGNNMGYPGDTLSWQLHVAKQDARRYVERYVTRVNDFLVWDGRTRPNG